MDGLRFDLRKTQVFTERNCNRQSRIADALPAENSLIDGRVANSISVFRTAGVAFTLSRLSHHPLAPRQNDRNSPAASTGCLSSPHRRHPRHGNQRRLSRCFARCDTKSPGGGGRKSPRRQLSALGTSYRGQRIRGSSRRTPSPDRNRFRQHHGSDLGLASEKSSDRRHRPRKIRSRAAHAHASRSLQRFDERCRRSIVPRMRTRRA